MFQGVASLELFRFASALMQLLNVKDYNFEAQRYMSLISLLSFVATKNLIALFFGEFWISLATISPTERSCRIQNVRIRAAVFTALVCLLISAAAVWSTVELQNKDARDSIAVASAAGLSLAVTVGCWMIDSLAVAGNMCVVHGTRSVLS